MSPSVHATPSNVTHGGKSDHARVNRLLEAHRPHTQSTHRTHTQQINASRDRRAQRSHHTEQTSTQRASSAVQAYNRETVHKTVGDVDMRMMQVHGGHRAGPCNIGRVRSDGQVTCAQWCAQQASVSRVPSARQLNTSARKAGLESQDVRRITSAFAGKTCNAGRS